MRGWKAARSLYILVISYITCCQLSMIRYRIIYAIDETTYSQTDILGDLHSNLIPRDHYWEDKTYLNHLLARWVCQKMISELGFSNEIWNSLSIGIHGKPKIDAPVDFSISHSHDCIAVAIADSGLVGIDVEKIRPVPFQEYKDQFSDTEWQSIENAADSEKEFFRLWTRKESIAKMSGLGMQVPFDRIHVRNTHGYIQDRNLTGFFSEINVDRYCVCICSNLKDEMLIESA